MTRTIDSKRLAEVLCEPHLLPPDWLDWDDYDAVNAHVQTLPESQRGELIHYSVTDASGYPVYSGSTLINVEIGKNRQILYHQNLPYAAKYDGDLFFADDFEFPLFLYELPEADEWFCANARMDWIYTGKALTGYKELCPCVGSTDLISHGLFKRPIFRMRKGKKNFYVPQCEVDNVVMRLTFGVSVLVRDHPHYAHITLDP